MITVRCSELPLALACPASVLDGGLRVDPVNEAGNVGSAAHEALRALVEHGSVEWERIGEIAANHGADEQEVRMLCAQGTKAWRQIGAGLPAAVTEWELPPTILTGKDGANVLLTGHIDVLSLTTGASVDWKSARVDHDYREQMLGYDAGVLRDNDSLDEARATIAWLRTGEVEHHTLRRADLAAWEERVTGAMAGWDGKTYNPGPQCTFCPRSHDCPAASALVRRDVAAVAGYCEPVDLSALDAVALVELHERVGVVARIADRLKDALKAEVRARGPIEANGARLEVVTEARREFDPLAAWPILEQAGFTDKDFAETMTLGVGKVEKRVADKAGRGNGAGAVRALAESMTAAGAVRLKPRETLERTRST